MKKRTYFLPVALTLIILLSIAFLVVALTRNPYDVAMKKGDLAMKNNNYRKAITEYTIAQTLDENQIEPYIKALNAIVLAVDKTVVRDSLKTINDCVEFCGIGSISDKQIADAMDILIASGNKQAAYDILNHLHLSYSESTLIREKFEALSLELQQPIADTPTETAKPETSPTASASPSESDDSEPTSSPADSSNIIQNFTESLPTATPTHGQTQNTKKRAEKV